MRCMPSDASLDLDYIRKRLEGLKPDWLLREAFLVAGSLQPEARDVLDTVIARRFGGLARVIEAEQDATGGEIGRVRPVLDFAWSPDFLYQDRERRLFSQGTLVVTRGGLAYADGATPLEGLPAGLPLSLVGRLDPFSPWFPRPAIRSVEFIRDRFFINLAANRSPSGRLHDASAQLLRQLLVSAGLPVEQA